MAVARRQTSQGFIALDSEEETLQNWRGNVSDWNFLALANASNLVPTATTLPAYIIYYCIIYSLFAYI